MSEQVEKVVQNKVPLKYQIIILNEMSATLCKVAWKRQISMRLSVGSAALNAFKQGST